MYSIEELEAMDKSELIDLITELQEDIDDANDIIDSLREELEILREFLSEKGLLEEYYQRFGDDI